jgi:ferric-dicitrate binding protein FerR (iron transport regulator)
MLDLYAVCIMQAPGIRYSRMTNAPRVSRPSAGRLPFAMEVMLEPLPAEAVQASTTLARAQRRVKVEGGEALFEVAKDTRRPFVVQAAGTEVVTTGTAFVVRLTPASQGAGAALAVTPFEGQVVVRAAGAALSNQVVMAAGDCVRLKQLVGVASGDLRGSGVFRIGDNASFARAVASLQGLVVRECLDWLELGLR